MSDDTSRRIQRETLEGAAKRLRVLENEQLRYSDATSAVRAETYELAIEEILDSRPCLECGAASGVAVCADCLRARTRPEDEK